MVAEGLLTYSSHAESRATAIQFTADISDAMIKIAIAVPVTP